LWEKVRISLVDERWVDTTLDTSNEKMVRATLLQSGAKAATFYGMHDDSPKHKALLDFNALLKSKLHPFDVVVLGMGSDGHTASLFPKRPELSTLLDMKSEQLCGYCEAPVEPKERMTLTLPAIASAAHCYLHIEGNEKLDVYHTALDGDDVTQMPVRAVFNACGEAMETFYA
jgi:6-phosphogluconolactonase